MNNIFCKNCLPKISSEFVKNLITNGPQGYNFKFCPNCGRQLIRTEKYISLERAKIIVGSYTHKLFFEKKYTQAEVKNEFDLTGYRIIRMLDELPTIEKDVTDESQSE